MPMPQMSHFRVRPPRLPWARERRSDGTSDREGRQPRHVAAGPRVVLAVVHRGHLGRGAALLDPVLLHPRPGLAAGDQPLPRGARPVPRGGAGAGVLRRRRAQAGRHRPLPQRPLDHPRGDRRRPERQPAVAVQHDDGRRPGDDRPPPHEAGRDLGGARAVPRARRTDVRRRREGLRPRDRAEARRGGAARHDPRRGHGPRHPGRAGAARHRRHLGGALGHPRRGALAGPPPGRGPGRRPAPVGGRRGGGAGAAEHHAAGPGDRGVLAGCSPRTAPGSCCTAHR